jgi:hypothetical protein
MMTTPRVLISRPVMPSLSCGTFVYRGVWTPLWWIHRRDLHVIPFGKLIRESPHPFVIWIHREVFISWWIWRRHQDWLTKKILLMPSRPGIQDSLLYPSQGGVDSGQIIFVNQFLSTPRWWIHRKSSTTRSSTRGRQLRVLITPRLSEQISNPFWA